MTRMTLVFCSTMAAFFAAPTSSHAQVSFLMEHPINRIDVTGSSTASVNLGTKRKSFPQAGDIGSAIVRVRMLLPEASLPDPGIGVASVGGHPLNTARSVHVGNSPNARRKRPYSYMSTHNLNQQYNLTKIPLVAEVNGPVGDPASQIANASIGGRAVIPNYTMKAPVNTVVTVEFDIEFCQTNDDAVQSGYLYHACGGSYYTAEFDKGRRIWKVQYRLQRVDADGNAARPEERKFETASPTLPAFNKTAQFPLDADKKATCEGETRYGLGVTAGNAPGAKLKDTCDFRVKNEMTMSGVRR